MSIPRNPQNSRRPRCAWAAFLLVFHVWLPGRAFALDPVIQPNASPTNLPGTAVESSKAAIIETNRDLQNSRNPAISTVGQVLTMPGSNAFKGDTVRLEGVVIYADPIKGEVLFKDSTGVIPVKVNLDKNPIQSGTWVTLDGKTSATLIRYPDHPSGSQYLTSFEAPRNVGDLYLARVRGFLHPPRTGEYTFWIASDNGSDLWLSRDENPANARKIATVSDIFSYASSRGWDSNPSQQSVKITLQANQKYYIEALHLEESGEDCLAVAWEGPGISRSVIDGAFLSPPSADARAGDAQRGSILREFWLEYPFADLGVLRNTPAGASVEAALKNAPTHLGKPGISQPRVTVLADKSLPEPGPISLEQPWAEEEEFRWVEAEGIITQVTGDGSFWTILELSEKEHRMVIRLANPQQRNLRNFLNARVGVRGFCEGAQTATGGRIASVLWVPSPSDISLRKPLNEDWLRVPLVSWQELRLTNALMRTGQPIRMTGRVLEGNPGQPLLVRDGVSRFSGLVSADGTNWTQLGDSIEIGMNYSVYAGIAVAGPSTYLCTATFDHVSMPLSPGTGVEVGKPLLPGGSEGNQEGIVVRGTGNLGDKAGADVTKDDCHFLFGRLNGDGEIVARVISVVASNAPWPGATAGIMIRESLDADSKSSLLAVNTASGSYFRNRRGTRIPGESFPEGKLPPYWLKLVRQSPPPILVHSTQTLPLPVDQAIEMMGVLDRTNQNWVLNQAFYRIVGNESRGSNAPAQPRTEITTVQQIRQLKAEELGQVPPAKIRGVVTAKITDLYLQDNTGGIRVPSWAWQKVGNCEVGQYIEVAGRCAPGGYSPVLEPGQQTDVTLLGMGRMPKPLSGTWNQLMQGKDDAQWVEVNGVIRNIQGRTLKMRMPGGDVLMDLGFGFREGYARNLIDATVRIQGVCRVIANEKKQLVGIRLIVPAAEFIVLDEVPPADPFAAPSQQVGKLLQFDDRDVVSHRVKIEGVVTCAREGVFYVQDTTGGIRVESPNDAVLHQGDRVEVVGFPDSGGFSVNLTDALIRKTGKASLPEPVELEAGGSPQAAHSSRFIKMTAVFLGRSTLLKNEVFQFQTGGRVFQGTLPEDQGFPPAIEPGSLAQLTGVCRVLQDRSGKYSDSNLEFEILLSSPADLVVLKAPDWWNLRRLLWIGGIFMGVLSVAAAWIAMISRKNRLLKLAKLELQKANEELETRVAHRTADLAKANSELSREQALLRALLDSSPDKIYFKDAQSRYLKTSKAQAQDFRAQSPDELIGKTDFDYFAEEHARPAFEDEQEIIHTGHPLIGKIEKEVRKDGQEGWVLTSKMPLRNEANEIVGTFGISKDITAIKHAEARLEEVHKQLVDASRQAGQAEVASSVLHNVGNVLNSVNVATGVITERVRGSKAATGISRVAGLLAEHRQDMAGFLAEDGRADKVTGYLEELAKQMGSEQASMLQELHDLARNVEHINEIVAMQQNYARVSGITEIQSVPALVEDALRVEANALVRNQVHVVKQFDPIPDILVDKHKVLQVLVNLITNAVNALSESTVAERVMTLKIKMNEDKNVSVSVADNGMGISPENLERIFTHGFTTRQDGHSLGLHSGFLAAREMGGTLLVHSDGPGKGAIFTLELPSQPKEKKSTVAGEAHHQRE